MLSSRVLTASAVLAAVAALATGCGSNDDQSTAPSSGASQSQGAAQFTFPGASGTIAAVSGTVVQVQSQTAGQTAVKISSSTSIIDQVKATAKDVTVGSCVLVRSSAQQDQSGTTTGMPSKVAATTVMVSTASGSSCSRGGTGGLGGRSGDRPSGAPSGLPSGAPGGDHSGGGDGGGPQGRGAGFGIGVSGKVTAVSAGGFTVAASQPGGSGTTSVKVTTSGSTTYTAEKKSDSSALEVGRCLTAMGSSDSTGTVSAKTASVSDPVDGQCGFGGFGAGRGQRPGGTA